MMVIGKRTRYVALGIGLVIFGVGVVCLTLKYGTSSFERWRSQPCMFPIQLPTILGVTTNLVTGQPGVIKVHVQSDYPVQGYWEERQGYTIGGRSSVSYLIPTIGARGYSSRVTESKNGRYTLVLRMRKTPPRNGLDNFSLHLIQKTPCNTIIMNFDPLELRNTTVTAAKILKGPLPSYDVTGAKFSVKFVAKVRNNTSKSESFRNIFGGTFVRVSWAEGENVRSVHSRVNADDTLEGVATTSDVITNKKSNIISVRSQIEFDDFNRNHSGLYAVGFVLYTSNFVAIKAEMHTELQAGSCSKRPPAIRVESCSDIVSPRTERANHAKVQVLAAVEHNANCIRVMTSGNPRPSLQFYSLRGRRYNNNSVAIAPAKDKRPLSGSFESRIFPIKNPKFDRPQWYLVSAKNNFGSSRFLLKIVLYRPVKLLEFYIEGVPKPEGEMAERTALWYDIPPQTMATLTCRASGYPKPTIRFFHIPLSNQTDSVFVLDPKIGDPTWTNLKTIDGAVIQTLDDNATDLVTSSVTLKSGFFFKKTDYIIACLAENRFFLNRKKIGFHVVRSP